MPYAFNTAVRIGENAIQLLTNGLEGIKQLGKQDCELLRIYEENNGLDATTRATIEMLNQRLTHDDISEQERTENIKLLEEVISTLKEKNDADREMINKFHNDNKETWWVTLRITAGILTLGTSETYFIPATAKRKKQIEFNRKAS